MLNNRDLLSITPDVEKNDDEIFEQIIDFAQRRTTATSTWATKIDLSTTMNIRNRYQSEATSVFKSLSSEQGHRYSDVRQYSRRDESNIRVLRFRLTQA